MKDSSSLCITMSDEGVICPLIDLLVDLFLYLLTFSYLLYVKEDVIQRKKRSTHYDRKMHKCHEKHGRHNLLSLRNAAKFSGEIIQVKTREKEISYRGSRIYKKPKYGTVRHHT